MNKQTIALVRASWSRVQPIAVTAAAVFYQHLFAEAPELRALFRGDLKQQGHKLMQMLDRLVDGLEDWPALASDLADLGRRHAGYGVRASHYDRVGTALLHTLADGLGTQFTPATERAWADTYQLVADIMIAAATETSRDAARPRLQAAKLADR